MEYGAVVLWWIIFQALAVMGLPIVSLLLSGFADRGAGLALPASLVVVTSVAYWVGHVSFGPAALLAGLAVLGAASVAATYRGGEISWRPYAEVAVVFTLAFALVVAIRAYDPAVDPNAGEKFLDFGLLKALLRADALPPEDMWFAGESVQYYYGGHVIAALLTELTGTPARYAYNLALAGFYGMLATAAYGVAGAIGADHGTDRRLAAGLGAFFVAFAGNLHEAARLLLSVLPGGLGRALAGPLGIEPEDLSADFFYWNASRVIEGTINEFPMFAWLNGDLHAHMMSTPFLLLVVALCYRYYRSPPSALGARRVALAAVVPVAGLLAVVNTWSFPTACGLVALALVFGRGHPFGLLPERLRGRVGVDADAAEVGNTWYRRETTRLGGALVLTAGVCLLAIVWVAPFFLDTASTRRVGFLPTRSGLGGLLVVHGAFLLAFAAYLLPRVTPWFEDGRPERATVLAAALLGLGWLADLDAVLLVGPFLLVAWLLLRDRADVGFETVLLVAGAGLVLLVEFVYVEEQAAPERMNTVFKVYMQVWVLWATGAAVALARVVWSRVDDPRSAAALFGERAVTVFAVALVLSTSFYGVFAVGAHFSQGGPETLDATRFAHVHHPHEAAAIEWLDANVSGQPNMLSAPGVQQYRWISAPSSLTGIPTVAGWLHEVGYRGGPVYYERVEDVNAMYTASWEQRRALLATYDVEYVYVGPEEREQYGENDFAQYPGISVAYRNENVTIYRVDQSSLGGG